MRLDRRTALKLGLSFSVHAAFGQHYSLAPQLIFPTEPRRRIAIASYPFRRMLIAPNNADRSQAMAGMELAEFAHYVRTEFNVYGIEPLHAHFASTELADVMKLKQAFDEAGVHTVNIPVDEQADLCSPDASVRQAGYAVYRKWVDIAVLLGSPSIRISVPGCAGQRDIAGPVRALQPVIEYAAAHKVIVNFENDDPVLANATRIVAVLRLAANPYLRALPDFANSLMGGDETFNADAVRAMFGYAVNIAHVKDAEVIANTRRSVSLPQLFGIAKQAGFKGYYSMESDSDADPVADTKHLIERCLALM